MQPLVLLNPGPVTLSRRVQDSLQRPAICHREPELTALQSEIRHGLLEVYGRSAAAWSVAALSGSGTAAVEAMLTSLVPRDGRLLVLENGVYGERMAKIARLHSIPSHSLVLDWGEELASERVDALLERLGDVTHIGVVHHETTTGRLNELRPLAQLCRRRGIELLVDAVSSFGAEDLACDEPAIAAYAGTAGKCLHGVPGLSFVMATRAAWARACTPPRTLYLDLVAYVRDQEAGGTPFTPAVPAMYALAEALQELREQGGWRARHDRYRVLQQRVRDGLRSLDIAPVLDPASCSVVLSSYRLPAGVRYEVLHEQLRKRGFVIYAGQAALRDQLFRISTMGEIADADVTRLLDVFREILR